MQLLRGCILGFGILTWKAEPQDNDETDAQARNLSTPARNPNCLDLSNQL